MSSLNSIYNASISNTQKSAMYCVKNFKDVSSQFRKVNEVLIEMLSTKIQNADPKDVKFLKENFKVELEKFMNEISNLSDENFIKNSNVYIKKFNNIVKMFKDKVIPIIQKNDAVGVMQIMRNTPKSIISSYKSIYAFSNCSKQELINAKNVIDDVIINKKVNQESLLYEGSINDFTQGIRSGIGSGLKTAANIALLNGKTLDQQFNGYTFKDEDKFKAAKAAWEAQKQAAEAATANYDNLNWFEKLFTLKPKEFTKEAPKLNNYTTTVKGGIDVLKNMGKRFNKVIQDPTSNNIMDFFLNKDMGKLIAFTAIMSGFVLVAKRVYNKIKKFLSGKSSSNRRYNGDYDY